MDMKLKFDSLKADLEAWWRKEWHTFEWVGKTNADMAFTGGPSYDLNSHASSRADKKKEFEDIVVSHGACYILGSDFDSTPTRIFFLPDIFQGTLWCVKINGKYKHFMDSKEIIEITRKAGLYAKEGSIVHVMLRPVTSTPSDYWACWETEHRAFKWCFEGEMAVRLVSPDLFRSAEKQNRARIINVSITEVA